MREIKFMGRGGQGVVLASHILGLAYFKAGMYPQCFSVFGGERRGAPVVGFLRIDKVKILLKCEIQRPDTIICFDTALLELKQTIQLMPASGQILLNTSDWPESLVAPEDCTVGIIDAQNISLDLMLRQTLNTAILGAYVSMTKDLDLGYLLEAISDMVPSDREINLESARLGYQNFILKKITEMK
jgi:2-oxoacid:acceptor oxidoreductase gamma subunit (pyruvate/2-ketoisovalerate family)